jgi:hypothetical protein
LQGILNMFIETVQGNDRFFSFLLYHHNNRSLHEKGYEHKSISKNSELYTEESCCGRKAKEHLQLTIAINHMVILQKLGTFIVNKRGVLLAFILLSSLGISSCSLSRHSIPEQGVLVGTVYRIGNEPFTKFGLQTPEGTVYILNCSKEIESELIAEQGKSLRVHYTSSNQSPEGHILRVVKIEFPSSQ